ncbi:hypothetical protein [Actinomadura livida]|uniref:Uncharacterized protein n=1 Tax=Actinomadura livida TaxID=79909 RepID=A0A7W7N024_9ACTN|nr:MULTISPECIES: hypothetical protein [Actinomadura]MBB4776674.1 hypothetical protein [Actinomadura catellatispora]GGT94029.1 hypothetical protein GCM10010208_16400 [Actinomadura livida]
MTTDPHDEHGEILRRALHAEADTVNPAGDGLERIRARIADGSGRRFGLGRFGPGTFGLGGLGFDRLTVGWARPVLAVAAAVAIAGLGVTAPQTIDLIQQSVGSKGPSDDGHDHAAGSHTATGGEPQFPDPVTPGGSASGAPSSPETPSSSSSPGLSSCSIQPPGTPTVAASPGTKPEDAPEAAPCPSDSPSQQPSTTPTPPTSTTPEPEQPTQAPSSPPPSETSQGAGQGAGSAGAAGTP